jgi:hypothetical protein
MLKALQKCYKSVEKVLGNYWFTVNDWMKICSKKWK